MTATTGSPASPVPERVLLAREQALDVSGWGERFVFRQPRNLCFWVFVILTGVGAVQAWSFFSPSIGLFGALAVPAVLCALFGLAWWAWLRHIDRWERQPGGLVAAALIWGAIPATFGFALTVNTALLQLYPKLFGQDWSTHWAAGFIAPFTEESAKLCGLVLLLGLAPRLVRTANDGLIIGAFIGLGFATLEDFLYAANATTTDFGTNPSGNALSITASRLAAGFVSHPMFSALVCTGAIYVIGTAAQPRRIGRGIAFIGLGMILHFTWDDAGGLGRGNGAADIGVFLLSAIIGFTVLTIAFRAAAPTEQRFVRDVLGPEVATGVVTDEEVTAVVDRHARKHYRKAAPDRQARRARKHLGQAILDLAHDIAAAKDAGTPAVEHSRSEVARLRANASDE